MLSRQVQCCARPYTHTDKKDIMKRKYIIYGTALMQLALLATIATSLVGCRGDQTPSPMEDGVWRKVMRFDVTDTSRVHKADLGNRTIVMAKYERPIGWDLNVYAYPVTETSENLLCDNSPSHGAQPWQSFAWGKRNGTFPDTRIIEYAQPRKKLKIVLEKCKTAKQDGHVVFTTGSIEIYHQP